MRAPTEAIINSSTPAVTARLSQRARATTASSDPARWRTNICQRPESLPGPPRPGPAPPGRTAEDLVVWRVEQAHRSVGARRHLRSRIGLIDDQWRSLPAQDFHLIFQRSARLQMAL